MRQIGLAMVLVTLVGLPASCGSVDEDDPGTELDAGTRGSGGVSSDDGGPSADAAGGAAGDSATATCPELLGLGPDDLCGWQTVVPTTEADGGLSAPPCVIPLELEDFDPDYVNVAVDCEVTRYCGSYYYPTDDCWQYDDADQPTAIVLTDPLCARITEEGFTVIDIMEGCRGVDL